MSTILILGATRGMGRSLARHYAEQGNRLILLGRNAEELEASAADARARGPKSTVETAVCDLESPESFAPTLESVWKSAGKVDTVIVTAALFGTQAQLEADPVLLERVLRVSFTNTILFCEEARKRLLGQGGGTLCVFSSVAGDRGRKPVGLYGAAKAGLSHYLEALDHNYRAQGLVTVCVKPGFVKTGMTAGLKPPPFAGEPDQVAAHVARAIAAGKPLIYTPFMWRWVMLVIRNLPRFVMRKINF